MKFLRLLMPYVAVAMTVCILTACSDDPKGIGSSTNQTADNLTAEANKVKFESIGQKVVNEFSNPQAHEELLRAINDFCYLADEYNLDVEKAGAYRATSAYWQTIGEICSTNNLTKTLSLTRTGGEFYRAAQYYGTYTYGNGKWAYSAGGQSLKFQFMSPSMSKMVVIEMACSGKETIVDGDEGDQIAIPEHGEAYLSVSGRTLATVTVNADLNDAAKTAYVTAIINADEFTFRGDFNATMQSGDTEFSLYRNNTMLVEGTGHVNGQRMTDPTENDKDNPENLFNDATASVNIMNEAWIESSCSSIKQLTNEAEQFVSNSELDTRNQCAAFNKYLKISVNYGGPTVAIIETAPVLEYAYSGYESWDMEWVIRFSSDGASYSLDSYFDEDDTVFSNLINNYEELEDRYEEYLQDIL